MNHRLRLALLAGVGLAAATSGCRQHEVRPEELFQAQSLGLSYLQTERLPEAETQFKKVIALAPREALGYANLGLTYLREARYAEAEEQLRRARDLDPASADIGLMAAKLYASTGRTSEARATLEQLRRGSPGNAHVLYALAELDAPHGASDSSVDRYEKELREVLEIAPTNLAVRLKLIDVLVRRGMADSAVRQLEEARRVGPAIPAEAESQLSHVISFLRTGQLAAARSPLDHFLHIMEVTSTYQASLDDVKWLEGPQVGRPVLTFTPKSLVTLRMTGRGKSGEGVQFVEATADAGLPGIQTSPAPSATGTVALGDYDGDGTDDLFASSPGQNARLYHVQGGQLLDVTERSGITLPGGAIDATFVDFDNDGHLDLFVIGGDQHAHLLRNDGAGRFQDVTDRAGITNVSGARKALFVDFDHDGDLDLLLVGGPSVIAYRNNLDGTFTDVSQAIGLGSAAAGVTRDAAFADFDGDGRTDIVVVREHGNLALYHNAGNGQFSDVSAASGITVRGGSAVAVGDYNNDGFFDILVAGAGSVPSLWLNDGRGKFVDQSAILPVIGEATSIVAGDADGDGDQDLFVGTPGGARFLRNDGGNSNLSMQVQLVGLRTGSGKNNDFGIGAKVEVRAAELYQTRIVTSRITHFGLGPHLKADVVRIEWPNGVPQTVFFPGSDQDVLENEVLKGSCAFLYTWDGHRFRFMTDVMWRSALGMPLGILGGNTAYAPAGASQEYLRIPGSVLRPRDGKYVVQLTEELWETAYADHVKLLAVDHPDSVNVFVDERFVPPGPVHLRMFHVAREQPPLSAVDDRGNDVLPALRMQDNVYVSNLTPLQYQGIVEPHDLIMDLGPDAGRDSTFLFLRGWIYPTDASINIALSQQSRLKTMLPSLDVRDARGRWTTAIANIGFPSGKDKTIVVDLSGRFPTNDHHVRIRTNLQIYWDQAFTARDLPSGGAPPSALTPLSADLHFRGYSRTYRKGGRYGPWWFDYDSVSKESPWRSIQGSFTRFGDVLSLLERSDDMYVIMAPGDEMTLEFDATSAPDLPSGWSRDFLLYTDGWIKDSDLNTAFGTTVGPLPFHTIRAYPYAPGESYPTDPAHQRYLLEYNTRTTPRRR